MKRVVDGNAFLKQYQNKTNVAKAVKQASHDAKSTMNDVRVLFNLQLARVY